MSATRSSFLGGILACFFASAAASAQCTAPASWFPHATTPAPGTANPKDDHCGFHQWSWQSFLWLTQTVDNDLRFITQMYSRDNAFSLEINQTQVPVWGDLPRRMLRLRPRDSKPTTTRGTKEINQAGDNGILVDQQGHAVYYAIHINQTYYDFIQGRGYFDPNKLHDAPDIDKFPVGTLEVKSAWRVVNPGDDVSGCYTTTAILESFETRNGRVVVNPRKDFGGPRKVALVGLHIAGVIDGHPEFVWSTFELRGNAPLLPPGMTLASPNPVSNTGARFYAANSLASDSNRPNNGNVVLDPTTQTLKPITQVVRVVGSGGGSDSEVKLVQSLNHSVHQQLGADVAANYNLIGSLWVKNGALQPNQVPGAPDSQLGSLRLANTTMETFRQPVGNCFNCHDTRPYEDEGISFPAKNLSVSHALRRTFILNTQLLQSRAQQKPAAAPKK